MSFWNQRSFCLITGASRGIGKCIAIEFAKKVKTGSVFVLMARSAEGLEDTKREILASSTIDLTVKTAAVDLGKPNTAEYFEVINSALATSGTSVTDFDHSILVHNAASLGNITLKATQHDNLQDIRNFYEFNLFSFILLSSQFFKIFHDSERQRSIIGITSDGAVDPFKTWSLYCAGKAARDIFIRSIVLEEPSISGISYAPGLVDTDIYTNAETNTGDTEFLQFLQKAKERGEILTPVQSITKLMRILEEKQYVKGEHVAYRDVPDHQN